MIFIIIFILHSIKASTKCLEKKMISKKQAQNEWISFDGCQSAQIFNSTQSRRFALQVNLFSIFISKFFDSNLKC